MHPSSFTQLIAAAVSLPYTRNTMAKPKVVILRTAGTNCDEETAYAWQLAGAETQRLHVSALIAAPQRLREFDILTLPGGFSYGDDISAGKILANQLIHHLSNALQEFVSRGRLVLGICNGFQVLVKAGLLPGWPAANGQRQVVTLTQNDSARFEDRWIHMRSDARPNAFIPPGTIVALPIAHGEGKLVSVDAAVRERLRQEGHIALTYCDAQGRPGPYPVNPNGSEDDAAALTDATGRIFGLMPHPERYVQPTQHPEWTGQSTDRADGRIFFETALRSLK